MRRLVVCTGIAILLGSIGPAVAAGAGAGWTIAVADLPGSATESDQVSAPSCWAPLQCEFVGDYDTSAGGHSAYLATVDGTTQSSVATPVPADAATRTSTRDVLLDDVSCPEAGACVAVGRYLTKRGSFAGLLVAQTGTGWSATRAPIASATNVSLTAVSCNTAQCVAVGTYNANRGVILVSTGGGTWTAPSISTPSGAGDPTDMTDVSCPPSGPCYVVGQTGPEGGPRQTFFFPSQSGWRGVYLPVPPGADAQRMSVGELACPSTGDCALLTTWEDTARAHTGLSAETFDDGVLSSTPITVPAGVAAVRYPRGIDCVVATWCGGVTSFVRSDGTTGTLLVGRSPQGWGAAIAPVPARHPDAMALLQDVSCQAVASCTAVGALDVHGIDHPLVEQLARGRLSVTVLDSPIPADETKQASLTGAACVDSACVATGYFDRRHGAGRGAMYAERG